MGQTNDEETYVAKVEDSNRGYWWLKANPDRWQYSSIAVGETQGYDLYTTNTKTGKKRKLPNMQYAKEGDLVIGYQSGNVHKIVALCKVVGITEEQVIFEKEKDFTTPIDYKTLQRYPELQDVVPLNTKAQFSLFRLTKNEFDFIIKLTEEENAVSNNNLVDIDKFNNYLDEFVSLVAEKQGEVEGKISFQGKFLEEEEGHKREFYNKYKLGVNKNEESLISTNEDKVWQKYLDAVDDPTNNFLYWGNTEKGKIKEILKRPEPRKIINRIYREPIENDEQLCNEAISLFGKRYAIIAFTFFLKDINRYVPVRPRDFKKYLEYLGADTTCLDEFTWKNYQCFLNILKNIQDLLNASNCFSEHVELIDANSFVWMEHIFIEDEKSGTSTDNAEENEKLEEIIGRNILYYGVPGSGKSFKVNEEIEKHDPDLERTERVVFHPEYTYSDFVGQILPRVIETKGDKPNQISYDFVPGPFTRILQKAYKDKGHHMHYLIIEEINRGNAPAIFGDVFQLLDRKYGENDVGKVEHGESEYEITNKDIAKAILEKEYVEGKDKVKLPANLTIYATMNTSDQNVFTLDTAFQRRWEMDLVKNDFKDHGEDVIGGSSITWGQFASVINEKILSSNDMLLSSEDKRLGAFFVTKAEVEDKEKFSRKVLKYLWDDAFKLNRADVFQKELNSLELVIKRYDDAEDSIKEVFNEELYGHMTGQNNDDTEEDVQEITDEDN